MSRVCRMQAIHEHTKTCYTAVFKNTAPNRHVRRHRPSSARVLSKVCRPLPVVKRGRDAKGLLLLPVPAAARRNLVLIAGGSTSSRGDRGCSGARTCSALSACCASVSWGIAATGLLPLSGIVSIVAAAGGSTLEPNRSALSAEMDGSADLGAGVAELCASLSAALPSRAVPRLEAPKPYLPERLPYTPPYTSPSKRRLLPTGAGSSL